MTLPEPVKLSRMKTLASSERRALRAKAHHLHPVVLVGKVGLTPAVLHEIDLALLAHELVKVRVFDDERAKRDALLGEICTALDCAAVQHLGKVLVVWRPNPALAEAAAKKKRVPEKMTGKPHAAKRHGPRPPADPVRERRRATKPSTTGGGFVRRGADRGKPAADVARPSGPPARDTRRSTTSGGARRPDTEKRDRAPRTWTGAKAPNTSSPYPPREHGGKPKPVSKRRPAGAFDRDSSPPRDRHAGKPPRPMTTAGPRGYGDKGKPAARRVPATKSSSGSTRKSPVGRRPPRDPLSSAPVPSRRRRRG